jgi:phosphotriesterase-related protein
MKRRATPTSTPRPIAFALLPKWNYTHIHDDVLPALREKGVTDDQLETMLVGNPDRYLGGASA